MIPPPAKNEKESGQRAIAKRVRASNGCLEASPNGETSNEMNRCLTRGRQRTWGQPIRVKRLADSGQKGKVAGPLLNAMRSPAPTTVFLRTRTGSADALPLIPLRGGIPLLSLGLAPSQPISIGVQVRAQLLGPRSKDPPRNPGSLPHLTCTDIGLEGRVIAARKVNDTCAEIVVRNEGWGKMRYAAILLHAIPRVTVEMGLWEALRSPNRGGWGEEYPPQTYTACLPAPHRGNKAAELASYPPVVEEQLAGLDEGEGTRWASNGELGELGRAVGGVFQTEAKAKTAKQPPETKRRDKQ
ncbi:hypothetical protein TRAPUB_5439 [Trametes pubescens]|uniref:Uncharacterized protein n=1 Tax=Trametes pubescens TaxID=154538 RepID=A0A1M2V8E4_TRAPU|nr:hypothetical protein TRAPUB_5439 [Trametes pubescens]